MPDQTPVSSEPSDKKPIQIGLLGCGVVGSGTIRTLRESADAIERKLGVPLILRRVCVRDLNKPRAVELDPSLLTDRAADVLDDPEIDIVAELMGGTEPAGSYILQALRSGKHVVTANKELVAKEGHQLLREAAARRLDCFFEGSVAGGIPIIRSLKVCLGANRILSVMGIVNGTTNYILTQMAETGKDFGVALAEAQAQGYAEADPTADVDAFDAVYKLAILASIAFHSRVPVDEIYREGIRGVTGSDIAYARELGYVIKLLAIGRQRESGLELRVHPAMVRHSHPLAAVNDVFNAVLVNGSSVGDVMFYGRGAGSLPTGSSVAADILEVARGIRFGGSGRLSCTCFRDQRVLPAGEIESNHYVRIRTDDRPGVIAAVSTVFGRHQVSLESILQKQGNGSEAEIVWITHRTQESRIRAALDEIAALEVVREIGSWIRVEE